MTNKEKIDILYGILKETVLFPNARRSVAARRGQIETYNLFINGYLLNGEFKEPDKIYPSIATQFIDETHHYEGEPEESKRLRERVKAIYESNIVKLGKEELSFKVVSKNVIKAYFEIVNMCIILDAYLKDKQINTVITVSGNIFAKERKITITPKTLKSWG